MMIALIALIFGVVTGAGTGDRGPAGNVEPEAATIAELPRGGTELLPRYRLVGYYGAPQAEGLGALGIGSPASASKELDRQAREYEGAKDGRPVLPFLELLATVANADPGEDGLYRTRQPRRIIQRYLDQARADRSLLVLDIQPGRSDFPSEMRRLAPFLAEPDVGLALDPEWLVAEGEVPGQVLGSVDASEVNRITRELARVVAENDLPQKLLIVHRFTADMIGGVERLKSYPGVALVLDIDGFGAPAEKIAKYNELKVRSASGLFNGFKLFYEEDTARMSPADVLKLKPPPDVVVYE